MPPRTKGDSRSWFFFLLGINGCCAYARHTHTHTMEWNGSDDGSSGVFLSSSSSLFLSSPKKRARRRYAARARKNNQCGARAVSCVVIH